MTSAYLPRAGISLWNPKHPPPSPFPLPCSDQWRHPRSERSQDHHFTSFSTGIFTREPQLLLPLQIAAGRPGAAPHAPPAQRCAAPQTLIAAFLHSVSPFWEAQPLQVHLFLDGEKEKIIKIWTHVLNKVSGSFWNVPEKPDGRAREGRLPLLLASPARPSPLPAADPPAALRCGPAAARPGTASERSGALSPRPCAPPRRAPPCPARGIPQHAAPLGEMAN